MTELFIRRKRPSHQLNIHPRNAHFACHLPPAIHCFHNFLHNLSGLAVVQSIKHGGFEYRFQIRAIICVVNIQYVFALVDIRIDIKRRSQPPARFAKGGV